MGRIRGWKRVVLNKVRKIIIWKNLHMKDTWVGVEPKKYKGHPYYFVIYETPSNNRGKPNHQRILNKFEDYEDARRYAVKWMRIHPGGLNG